MALELQHVEVESLVPEAAGLQRQEYPGAAGGRTMRAMHDLHAAARRDGQAPALCRTADGGRSCDGRDRAVDATMPFANMASTDNIVRFVTDRYFGQSADRAGPRRRAGSDRRRRVRRPAAARRVSRRPNLESGNVTLRSATAFAPATVGNVGVGFDILGHAFPALGDRVRAERVTAARGSHRFDLRASTASFRSRPPRTLRARPCYRSPKSLTLPFGIDLSIEKGIPIGSGLGGSAASAVAAVVAANELLDQPVIAARAADARDPGRGRRERLAARRQRRAVALWRPGV